MFELSSPWLLLLLAGIPWLAWRLLGKPRRPAFALSTAYRASRLEPTWRQRTSWIVPLLELIVLVLIVLALARPRSGLTQRPLEAEGVAIQLVVDRSGSMERDDFQLDGKWVTRLDAVKNVAGRFVAGDETLSGRASDVVGIIAFASHADAVSPLTIDHDHVLARLEQTSFVTDFRDDGTAIGDALGLAVASLIDYDKNRAPAGEKKRLRKVVVLLTDGQQNIGELDPLEAARLAKAVDVKVHVIGIRPSGDGPAAIDAAIDTLRQVADVTGGEFYLASNTEALVGVYRQIDELEKTKLEETRYTDYREWAIESFRLGPFGFPPLALMALLLMAARLWLDRTIYRTIP